MPKLENGYGRAPDAFNTFVEDIHKQLVEEEQMKLKHKSIGGIWVFAIVLLLVMGTALAVTGGFGVLDFKEPANPDALVQNVQDLTGNQAVETPLVIYQVQDALIDGSHLMFTIACEAKEPEKYMLVPDSDPRVAAGFSEKTYEDLAKEMGKEMLYVAPPLVSIEGEDVPFSIQSSIQEGKLYWLLEPQDVTLKSGMVEVACKLHDSPLYGAEYVKETDESLGVDGYLIPDFGEGNDATLTFSVENMEKVAKAETVRFIGPIETEYAAIDWVEYTRENLATRLRVQFTLHENLSADDLEMIKMLNFRVVNGPDDEHGIGMNGSTGRLDGKADLENIAGVIFLQDMALQQDGIETAPDGFPDVIYLRPRYTGRVFGEIITLPISEGERLGN